MYKTIPSAVLKKGKLSGTWVAGSKNIVGYRQAKFSPRTFKIGTKPCQNKHFKCPLSSIEGYNYCPTHILQDDTAPFQQCTFTYISSSKRCIKAAAGRENKAEAYCPEHLNKIHKTRSRATRIQPPNNATKHITSLQHHIKSENPFKDTDAIGVNSKLSNILDYCSESESDVEPAVIDNTARCFEEDWSDAESVNSSGEDPLKYATVLTADEALERAKKKTQRLRNLYADQLTRLTQVWRERRRDYLHASYAEKDTSSTTADLDEDTITPKDLHLMEKTRAYRRYRRTFGKEAILHRKMKQKKAGHVPMDAPRLKCTHAEDKVKCLARTLPSSRYCLKHILSDSAQVLFRPCGVEMVGTLCEEPIAALNSCVTHMQMTASKIVYNTSLTSEEDDELKDTSILKQELNEEVSIECNQIKTEESGEGHLVERGSEEGEIQAVLDDQIIYQDMNIDVDYGQEIIVSGQ